MSYEAPPPGEDGSAAPEVWALALATNGHHWPKLSEPLIPWAVEVLNRLEAKGYVMVKRGEVPEWMRSATAAELFSAVYVERRDIPENFYRIKEQS